MTGPAAWALAARLRCCIACMFFGWFYTVIGENQHGIFNAQVDRSFRMGMMWFIFSEVMFFAAFFGALFYARTLSVPWLGGEGVKVFTNFLLWPHYDGTWPTNGPAHVGGHADGTFETMPAFGLPAINTADPADQRRHGDHRAPRAARRQARRADGVPGADLHPGLHLRGAAGPRVRRGLYASWV